MSQANASRWATAILFGFALVLAAVNALSSQPLPAEGVEYAEAVFFVKFTEPACTQIALSKSEHTGRTGIASVDRLNEATRVQRVVPVFRHGGRFEARHRAYGLDRWYRVHTDGSIKISDVLGRYRSDPHIQAAELQAIPSLDVLPEEAPPPATHERPKEDHRSTRAYDPTSRLAPNDTDFSQQWSLDNFGQDGGTVDADIDLPEAWTIETGDPSVVVAVLDTGLDPDHPELAQNIWRNPSEIPDNGLDDDDNGYVDDTWGWDFFNDDNDPTYGEGHGTHTSGTVVAATNNETGVAGVAGGWGPDDPGARVMVLAGHWGYPEAIVYAADNGATIASYSWSGSTFTFQIVEDAFRYFIDNAAAPDGSMQGGLIIFSAGNEGTNQWQYPKAYSEIIAVSATDRKDLRPSWSNYGEWVDIAAPGVSVLSTFIHDSYRVYTGTSMAAPHVAGVAALVRSARPDLPAAAVRYVLEHTTDLAAQKGRLNAHRALEMATGDLPNLYAEPPDLNFRTVTSGTDRSIRVTLWNIGSVDHTATLASDNPRFQASATGVVVPAGSTAAFEVVFTPTRKELEQGILTLNAGGETIQLPLRGDAHEFTDHYAALQDVSFPSLEWADFDDDGDLDLLLTGESGSPAFKERHAIVYANNGDQTFTDAGFELNGVTNGQGSWVDFDNDGDFDILLTGESTATFDTRLLRNDGDGLYILTEANLPPLVESSLAWADVDNDGFRDLAIMGADPPYQSQPQRHLLIYRNRGVTDFEQVASLHGVSSGDLAWSDYDNDGDVDLAACGWNGVARSTVLYRNDNGLLTESDVSLTPVKDCSVTWGDLDNDGDADLLVTGETSSDATTVLYRNDGNGALTNIGQDGLAPARVGSASFGDYDNDGDLDILLTGYSGVVRFSRVWRNNGAFSFTAIESFVGLATSAGAWADFDLDGDLDAIVAGQDQEAKYTRLYRNEGAPRPNNRPEPPSGLNASVAGGSATLSWSSGSDAETPSASLTYELRIGSIPGESDVVSSRTADDGRRLVVQEGSVGHVRSWTIRNLENGAYYWTVQSVDNGFSGSPFALEATFTITDSPIVSPNLTEIVPHSPADSATGEPTTISLSWAPVADARFYQVQVSATEDFGAIVVDEMTIASAVDFVSPVAERRYHWRVRALRGESVGPWSAKRTFSVGAAGDYSAQLVSPDQGAGSVVQPLTLVWTAAPKASEYELQVASSPSFQSPEVVRTHLTTQQQTVSGLSPGARFHWRVRGLGSTGEGTWTTTRTFETLALPGIVSLLEPSNGAIDQGPNVTMRWSAAYLADSYRLQIDSTGSFQDPVVDDSTVAEVEWTSGDSLPEGVTYSWRVRAQNAGGVSLWSDPWQFTVARGTGAGDEPMLPAAFRLYPVYPDPAVDRFTVSFDLPNTSPIRIELFDALGRHKMDLLREILGSAHHERVFTVGSVASGLYLIRIETAGFMDTVPLLIIRRQR